MVAASQWVMFPVAHWNTGGFLTYKVLQEEGSRTFNARDFSCFLSTTVHAGLRGLGMARRFEEDKETLAEVLLQAGTQGSRTFEFQPLEAAQRKIIMWARLPDR